MRFDAIGSPGPRTVLYVPGLAAGPAPATLGGAGSLWASLHGAGFTPVLAAPVLSWRARGQGFADHVDALGALIAGLPAPVDLVGHSMGGLLSLAVAARGAPVRRIVTLGTGVDLHHHPPIGLGGLGPALSTVGAGLRALPGALPVGALARALAPQLARHGGPIVDAQFAAGSTPPRIQAAFFRDGVVDLPFALLADLAGALGPRGLLLDGQPLHAALGALRLPVLCVGASGDPQVPPGAVADLAARLPHGALVLLPGPFAHLDLLTAPAATAALFPRLRAFLAEPA
jgi:pimeloyl-ACP methyl ester carboxylesterase